MFEANSTRDMPRPVYCWIFRFLHRVQKKYRYLEISQFGYTKKNIVWNVIADKLSELKPIAWNEVADVLESDTSLLSFSVGLIGFKPRSESESDKW